MNYASFFCHKAFTNRHSIFKVASATFLLAMVSSVQAADSAETNIKITQTSSVMYSANQCDSTDTTVAKNNRSRQYAIACMTNKLQVYQLENMTARQQYFAYKAQAWLNYANHEDSIKSRSSAGTDAFETGVNILQALETGDYERLNLVTDIPSTSALMRPDLWATLNALKASRGIESAPRELAYSEVALIWAAANQCEHGWRQSSAHFRMADRWLEQAREAYVNTHNSQDNVILIELINRYYKQYAPLDPSDDNCRGQALPVSI